MSYNLLDEKWIPVLYRDGRAGRVVSLVDCLRDAHEISELREQSPIMVCSLYRFVIAVVHWLDGSGPQAPVQRAGLLAAGQMPSAWLEKLAEYRTHFDLLSVDRPFLQDAELSKELAKCIGEGQRNWAHGDERMEAKPAAYLATEIPTSTYKAHFWHSLDEESRLCLRCCVNSMLTLPAFCTGVGQGNETSINDVPPVYFLIQGRSLLETIAQNLPAQHVSGDVPAWEGMKGISDQIGPLEGLTWRPRRIALLPDLCLGKTCDRCGETQLPTVHDIVFVAREGKKRDDTRLEAWRDPHVARKMVKKGKRQQWVGVQAEVDPLAWIGRVEAVLQKSDGEYQAAENIEAVLPCEGDSIDVRTFMLVSDRANFEHWGEERWLLSKASVADVNRRAGLLAALGGTRAGVEKLVEGWPERVWQLRYPGKRVGKSVRKAWKQGREAAAMRQCVYELSGRLRDWLCVKLAGMDAVDQKTLGDELHSIFVTHTRAVAKETLLALSGENNAMVRERLGVEAEALIQEAGAVARGRVALRRRRA